MIRDYIIHKRRAHRSWIAEIIHLKRRGSVRKIFQLANWR